MKELPEYNLLCCEIFLEAFGMSTGCSCAAGVEGVLHLGVKLQDAANHFEARHGMICLADSCCSIHIRDIIRVAMERQQDCGISSKRAAQSACVHLVMEASSPSLPVVLAAPACISSLISGRHRKPHWRAEGPRRSRKRAFH